MPRPGLPERRSGPRLRWIAAGGVALILALGAGVWLLLPALSGDAPRGPDPASVLPPRPLTPAEIADPGEARRAAELEELRGRYASLRASFGEERRPAPRSVARLEPALHALFPGRDPAWKLECVGQLCRVDAPGPSAAWHARLQGDPALQKLVERVVVDPDGAATPAYMMLVAAGAEPGDDALRAVEEEFLRDSDARECLSREGVTGQVTYVLRLDGSGYSFRQETDLPLKVVDCVDLVLTRILDSRPPPRSVRAATRTFTLRR